MKEFIQHKVFAIIAEAAKELGVEAFVIGGFVRDNILKRKDPKDIDIVATGRGIDLAQNVAKRLGRSKVSVFKNFGTAQVIFKDLELEFVGARKESYSRDSRKPIVEDGTLEDDQNRRDFTINAMAISLNTGNFGELVDPFDGLKDLEKGILKTPLDPDITFSDDPLRMLRAIRFASQLNFEIESESLKSIGKNKDRLDIISSERIVDELNKIMLSPKPSVGLRLLEDCGIMKIILPEITALKGVEEMEGQLHKDNFYHTLQVVDNIALTTNNLYLRYAALFHDIGKPVSKKFIKGIGWTFHHHEFIGAKMIPKIFRRMKFPLGESLKFTQKIVQLSSRPIAVSEETATDSAARRLLFEAGDDIDDLMLLCEADITTRNEKKREKFLLNFAGVRQKLKEVEEKDKLRNWQAPIDGAMIMKTFKLKPGKEIGLLKEAIKEAILEGEIKNSQDEAYEFMIKKATEIGLLPESIEKESNV